MLVELKVRNVGRRTRVFNPSLVEGFTADNKKYEPNAAATLEANNGGSEVILVPLQPGDELTAKLVFSVPPGTKLTRLVLHDFPNTPGTEVRLD